ncbi:MAG TPA: hypothetical protein VM370_00950 [Candidatus Thermoplasmatota archaeon]|nr:hypothetical protein [Candidatus Thermoplasmatota archaeon]
MTTTASTRLRLRANLHLLDYAILALAFMSLLVFVLDRTRNLPAREASLLRVLDLLLVVLYGGAFATKWLLADRPIGWIRRNAPHAFGVLPITINVLGFFIADRYFIVIQVIVVVMRTGEALDRAFGERILQGLWQRYQSMIVEELTQPLLMRLAIVLEEAVTSRDYAAAIGRRLDDRRDLVEAAIKRSIQASPKLSRISQFGPVERWIDETTQEIVDAAYAGLTSEEINTLIREGLHDAFTELKLGIAERKWQGKGVGVTDVARGVVAGGAPP